MTAQVTKTKIAGLIVYWTTHDCEYEPLRDGFEAESHFSFPQRSTVVALRAVLDRHFNERRFLIRPLQQRTGYEVLREIPGKAKNQYPVVGRFFVTDPAQAGQPKHVRLVAGDDGEERFMPETTTFFEALDRERTRLGKDKVARMMAMAVEKLWGYPLKNHGGAYWLPEEKLDDFNRLASIVESTTVDGEAPSIQAMEIVYDAKAVKAVAASITREVEKDVADLVAGFDTLDKDQIRGRIATATDLKQRIAAYEKVLGPTLDACKRAVEQVEIEAAGAALVAAASGMGGG